jgi:hypothetical protein
MSKSAGEQPQMIKMVARRGYAPRIPGCWPGVMLFHHRAGSGCRAWIRTTIFSFKARCPTVGRLGKLACRPKPRQRLVGPEVVATSPRRIKSPVPVCCGFEPVAAVAGLAPAESCLKDRFAGAASRSRPSARSVTLRGPALIECDSAYKADGSL